MLNRTLNLLEILAKKSHFLLGPRGTGKSALIKTQILDGAIIIDLLEQDLLLRLSSNPHLLESLIVNKQANQLVVIDEVQKVPALLDEVHRLIEKFKLKFLLTGSSARKLKRGQANLLAGRAWIANLFPLTSAEIPDFDLMRYLLIGGLPFVWTSSAPEHELNAYLRTYLTEEIQMEGLIRRLPQFSRFLEVAAMLSGQQLNYTKIGADSQVAPSTVREFVSILEDTLLGFRLPPWRSSRHRKAVAKEKFYLFDTGVTNSISRVHALSRVSDLYGNRFEQFIAMELRAALSYKNRLEELSFWRSQHGYEVDFLIGEDLAIECKATLRATAPDLKGLLALKEESVFKRYFLITQDQLERVEHGVHLIPWDKFLARLWNGDYL